MFPSRPDPIWGTWNPYPGLARQTSPVVVRSGDDDNVVTT